MERGSEILCRIFQYTGVDAARNVLHYLHRAIGRTIFCKGQLARKWLMQTTEGRGVFLSGETSVVARNRYYGIMILQGYSRLTRIFPPVSARAFPFVIWDLTIESDTVRKRSDIIYWDSNGGHVKFVSMFLSSSLLFIHHIYTDERGSNCGKYFD